MKRKSRRDKMFIDPDRGGDVSPVAACELRYGSTMFRSYGARASHGRSCYKHITPTELRSVAPNVKKCIGAVVLLLLITTFGSATAQRTKKPRPQSQPTLAQRLAKARAEVIAATNAYKASLEPVLKLQEAEVKTAAELHERRKALLDQQIIAKKEVEESERALADAQLRVSQTKRMLAEADNVIAETRAEEQLDKLGPARLGAYQSTAALIRYNGATPWALSDTGKVQSFFSARFNQALPISAFGQTAVHNQLGFAHHNSIDVAVSPDSAAGQALMAYLRSAGIPFIAFRHAVRGAATGAHIHIGYPSRRIAR